VPARPLGSLAALALAVLAAACSNGATAAPATTTPTTRAASTTTTTRPVRTTTTPAPTTAAPTTEAPTTPAPETVPTTTYPPTPGPGATPGSYAWPAYWPRPPLASTAALTGFPAGPEITNLPIVAAKIDNAPAARPQWGIELADVVIEENVESLTRFIALFHSRTPGEVGPVRSARTSDLPVLAALNRPVLAWSGGNPNVTAAVRAANDAGVLMDVTAQHFGGCYRRERSRRAPHNLLANPTCARAQAPWAGPGWPLWRFMNELDLTPYPASTTLDVPMDGVSVSWALDPSTNAYVRWQNGRVHTSANGTPLAYTNVIVLRIAYVPSPADARSPEAQTVGTGPMLIMRNGRTITGTWSRSSPFEPFTFADDAGNPVGPAAGTTFVELARA
jgi:hypothetical protein